MDKLVTIVISAILSIITAWFTSKIAFKSDIKKRIHSEREILYIDIIKEIDKILSNSYLVWDDKLFNFLMEQKYKMKLLASNQVLESYRNFLELIWNLRSDYEKYCSENNPINDEDFWQQDYEGELYPNVPEAIEDEFKNSCNKYKLENTPKNKDIKKHIDNLYEEMRKDIGSYKR